MKATITMAGLMLGLTSSGGASAQEERESDDGGIGSF